MERQAVAKPAPTTLQAAGRKILPTYPSIPFECGASFARLPPPQHTPAPAPPNSTSLLGSRENPTRGTGPRRPLLYLARSMLVYPRKKHRDNPGDGTDDVDRQSPSSQRKTTALQIKIPQQSGALQLQKNKVAMSSLDLPPILQEYRVPDRLCARLMALLCGCLLVGGRWEFGG